MRIPSSTSVFTLFAQDLSDDEKTVVHATQGPVSADALGGVLTKAAWHDRPTFYLIGDQDHAIPRAEQERMGATVGHVNNSHVPMLSQPEAVAAFILDASA